MPADLSRTHQRREADKRPLWRKRGGVLLAFPLKPQPKPQPNGLPGWEAPEGKIISLIFREKLARPQRFERPTFRFVAYLGAHQRSLAISPGALSRRRNGDCQPAPSIVGSPSLDFFCNDVRALDHRAGRLRGCSMVAVSQPTAPGRLGTFRMALKLLKRLARRLGRCRELHVRRGTLICDRRAHLWGVLAR